MRSKALHVSKDTATKGLAHLVGGITVTGSYEFFSEALKLKHPSCTDRDPEKGDARGPRPRLRDACLHMLVSNLWARVSYCSASGLTHSTPAREEE